MVEEQRAELTVLILNVILHCCLTGPAQLVGLLQVMLVGFNFLIKVFLQGATIMYFCFNCWDICCVVCIS